MQQMPCILVSLAICMARLTTFDLVMAMTTARMVTTLYILCAQPPAGTKRDEQDISHQLTTVKTLH